MKDAQKLVQKFRERKTPFYYYDLELLSDTLVSLKSACPENWKVHYALKANSNPVLLGIIGKAGLGADCVSGNEVLRAVECGFSSADIVFAGVGKSDQEILHALNADIGC